MPSDPAVDESEPATVRWIWSAAQGMDLIDNPQGKPKASSEG